jgi:DnaJ homologue, subfamily C, member 28, conserved domain
MPIERAPESLVDRQIREAAERGEFDDLAGSGKPIGDLGAVYDPDWWVKRYLEREGLRDEADLLRQTIRTELPRLKVMSDRAVASERVDEINELVDAVNARLAPQDRLSSVAL